MTAPWCPPDRQTGSAERHIVVLALRRSGTTALWRLLRQDPTRRCYDEPLNPYLRHLPANNAKNTWDEFIALRARSPATWGRRFAPVPRALEWNETLSARQVIYLRYLAADGPMVIDETRAPGRLAALRAALGPSVFVHLYRHPVAFASSHMIASPNRKPLRQHLHRAAFFRRPRFFNAWGMEDFWRPPLRAQTEARLVEQGVGTVPARAPAIHKLMALWLASYRRIERDGRRLSRGGFCSLSFEAFCAAPRDHLDAIRAAAGQDRFGYDLSGLHAASRGYRPDDPRWRDAALEVGFSADEIMRFFPASSAS